MQNRIVFKVFSTGLNFLISVALGILVPRAIGPSSYGDFSYVIATYGFLFQILMFSSNAAYVYFLSHGKYKAEDINIFYFLFLFTISILVVIIGIISANTEFGVIYLWNGLNENYLLYLGLLFAVFLNLQDVLVAYSDSTGQTVQSEKIKLLSRFLIALIIIFLIYKNKLDIYSYFILLILNFILFFVLFFKFISFKFSTINKVQLSDIFNDLYIYIRPLVIFTFIASVYAYLGKYVLQSTSGSLEQGYYNFAYQLAFIPVTFIFAIMVIYMSEMTKKFKDNDLEGVKEIFLKNIFKIYAIHAFISFFMLINAKEIILLTVGIKYLDAVGALQGLTIFSLLHTFGTLSRNIFLSSARTKQYSNINSISMIIGIIYLLFILKTSVLTSFHLAIIMAVFYFFRVFIQLIINIKFLYIDGTRFFIELFIVTITVLLLLKMVYLLNLHIINNILLSTLLFIILNFIVKDYLNLKSLKGGKL